MGRGYGGYTEAQPSYKDSGGHKVTDNGAIFVAERYMEMGYETVFRQRHGEKSLDLTIKTSNDKQIIKHIEVKMVSSDNPSQIAKNIKKAGEQIKNGDTVAIYLPSHTNNNRGLEHARKGIDEARRKGYIKGPVEVWFKDKTKIEL